MMAIDRTTDDRLTAIAAAVSVEHRACEKALATTLTHAIRAGTLPTSGRFLWTAPVPHRPGPP
jgi:hypothetical protein